MKKLSCILLSGIALISLNNLAYATEIGVAWLGKSSMADRVLAGVQETLTDKFPDAKLEIKSALDTKEELDAAVKGFETSKDGIIVLRSNGSAYLSGYQPSVPTFIGGGNNPVALGVMKNANAPEGNITGVTYAIPLEDPLASFMAIGGVSSFLLLSQANYASSPMDWAATKTGCDALGITCEQALVGSVEELSDVVSANKDKYDAFILGNQSLIFSNAKAATAAAGQKPVFSYAEKGVEEGALAGIVADDNKLGRMLGDSIVSVLGEKKSISEVPVKVDEAPRVIINFTTVASLGIDVPGDFLNIAEIIE